MANSFNVLIIDDHPLIIKAYQAALKHISKTRSDYSFDVDTADDCDGANDKIQRANRGTGLDLVFLDISLPPSENGEILSGEDLGLILRDILPKTKIIVSTTYTQNVRLNSLLQSVKPDGFLIKTDVTPEILVEAIETVIIEPPFYSKTVLNYFRKRSAHDFALDKTDRRLLFELTRGAKMNELPEILNLSLAAIERRKRILKEEFDVEGRSDRDLILAAEMAGFI